ncbi:MAG: hypothetical protein A2176_09215 [Spirochaetes bacterium RBG_13_51_14]|nr:MAG: hypothetical protein A2176_09215 [Spirochaetes bacterium RBG_13_51_14]
MKSYKVFIFSLSLLSILLLITKCDFIDSESKNSRDDLLKLCSGIPEKLLTACSADSDCIITKKDCCGCQMGGESFSINKIYEGCWTARLYLLCNGIACAAVYLCDDPMAGRCISNACTLVSE